MTILVTGATGAVARAVIEGLVGVGAPVRAASRASTLSGLPDGVERARVDLADPVTLRGSLDGVDRVFLYAEPAAIDGVVAELTRAGVEHVVLLSSLSVVGSPEAADEPFATDDPITHQHRTVERALAGSTLPWTFLRPGAFATNARRWGPLIRAEGVVRASYPEAHRTPIHERDIADVALRALLEPARHRGAHYELTGPESLTQRQQVDLIAAATNRTIRFDELTPDQERAALARTMPPALVDVLMRYQSEADGVPGPVLDGVTRVTGRPARGFATWARDHAHEFRADS